MSPNDDDDDDDGDDEVKPDQPRLVKNIKCLNQIIKKTRHTMRASVQENLVPLQYRKRPV